MDEQLRDALQRVPAIAEGVVEVVRWARIPGLRTKLVVRAADASVDPVALVVGPDAAWIRAVVEHLRGEPIDLVPYQDSAVRLVPYAVAPARVDKIIVAGDILELVVPDEDLDRILGPDGQWLQLAAQLVGATLNVFPRSRIAALEAEGRVQLAALGFLDEAQVSKLLRVGIYGPDQVTAVDESWLTEVLASPEVARRLVSEARRAR